MTSEALTMTTDQALPPAGDPGTPGTPGVPSDQPIFEPVGKRPHTYRTGGQGNPLRSAHREPKEGEDELMKAAVQDARVATETRALPTDGALSDEQRKETIATVRAYMERNRIATSVPARQLEIGVSTISQVLSGNYAGNKDKIIRRLNLWTEQHARGLRPGLPGHQITTSVCEKMIAVCLAAQKTRKMAIITGPSGNSKSMICQAIERGGINGIAAAIHIELDVGHGTALGFSKRVAERLKQGKTGTTGALMDRIIDSLIGTDRMLLIDEAHFMDVRARQVALGIHKRAGVPIVFFGTEIFDKSADDTDNFDGQFTSHLVWRYRITAEQEQHPGRPLYSADDIIRLAQSMELKIAREAASYLAGIASVAGLGSLRLCSMLLLRASLPAKRTASCVIELGHVRAAWERSHGAERVKYSESRSRAMQSPRQVKTA